MSMTHLVETPKVFKAVWISNPPNFTIIKGGLLNHPEQWSAPTHNLLTEMVHMAVSEVMMWHSKETLVSIICTKDAAEKLCVGDSVEVVTCLSSGERTDDVIISASHFHTTTITIRYDPSK